MVRSTLFLAVVAVFGVSACNSTTTARIQKRAGTGALVGGLATGISGGNPIKGAVVGGLVGGIVGGITSKDRHSWGE